MIPSGAFHLFAASCGGGSFFGLPTWYKYLPCTGSGSQTALLGNAPALSDVWLIVAAVIEILLRIAGLVAVVMVVYGGIQLMISQGEPDKIAKARTTVTNALVGLAIAILAASLVNFIATRIH